MITSYHNHSRWSDGTCTIAEQIAMAAEIGLDEVGISDHFVMAPPGLDTDWSMPLDRLGEYVAEVQAAANASNKPVVRLGVEADFFPETVEALRARLAGYPFDYVIGSVHYVD